MKIKATDVPPRNKLSNYPEPFASRMAKKTKRQLGDFFHLTKFGVNLTLIEPSGESALLHHHSKQEEFIYILSGNPTLITEAEEFQMGPGDCAGFIPSGPAHKLVNRTDGPVQYLEIGDRESGDKITYPQDDLQADLGPEGKWIFTKKTGERY